jgi:hypothetical protein
MPHDITGLRERSLAEAVVRTSAKELEIVQRLREADHGGRRSRPSTSRRSVCFGPARGLPRPRPLPSLRWFRGDAPTPSDTDDLVGMLPKHDFNNRQLSLHAMLIANSAPQLTSPKISAPLQHVGGGRMRCSGSGGNSPGFASAASVRQQSARALRPGFVKSLGRKPSDSRFHRLRERGP